MRDVVIVDAVRTPVGKRNGSLAHVHANDLLGGRAARGHRPHRHRSRARSARSSAGASSRSACRAATSPATPGSPPGSRSTCRRRPSTCSAARRSRRTTLAHALVAGGLVDVALACGVETMSAVPMGSSTERRGARAPARRDVRRAVRGDHAVPGRATASPTRGGSAASTPRCSASRSQDRAARAWAEGRFDGQLVPVAAARDARRGPAGDLARGAVRLAHEPPGSRRRAHGRDVVADRRRRRRRSC